MTDVPGLPPEVDLTRPSAPGGGIAGSHGCADDQPVRLSGQPVRLSGHSVPAIVVSASTRLPRSPRVIQR